MSPAVRLLRTYSIPLTLPPSLKAYSRQVQWPLFRRFHSVRLVYLCPPSLSFSPSVYGYVCAVCFGVSNDFISPVVDLWLSRTVQERGGGGVGGGERVRYRPFSLLRGFLHASRQHCFHLYFTRSLVCLSPFIRPPLPLSRTSCAFVYGRVIALAVVLLCVFVSVPAHGG